MPILTVWNFGKNPKCQDILGKCWFTGSTFIDKNKRKFKDKTNIILRAKQVLIHRQKQAQIPRQNKCKFMGKTITEYLKHVFLIFLGKILIEPGKILQWKSTKFRSWEFITITTLTLLFLEVRKSTHFLENWKSRGLRILVNFRNVRNVVTCLVAVSLFVHTVSSLPSMRQACHS